jgi:hypothetical protein
MAAIDALSGRFVLSCPRHGTSSVRLSSFRRIERLPGAVHPAAYRIEFTCGCGDDHLALVSQHELDRAPLGLDAGGTFVNLMTARHDDLAIELAEIATARISAGEWPWTFFCYPEDRARPVEPSCFTLLAAGGAMVAVAVLCPVCGSVSINVVSRTHIDVPFVNDARIGVVAHVFPVDALRTIEQFRAELHSAVFDERRVELEP